MGVQARPCQALHTHDFSPLSKGEATEGSAQGEYRQHHSGCNMDLKPAQILQDHYY